jgi:GT2 family glycosyltransferase
MSEQPDGGHVVIIVVSWNGLKDTLHCLTALRKLTYADRRVVLVDNGSQDGTAAAVRRYFPEVHVIANRTNEGYVGANNQGIAWALVEGARWILMLNNDVVVKPGALTEMVRVGERVADVGIVGPVMQRTLRPDILDLGGDLDFRVGQVWLRRYTDALAGQEWTDIDYVWGCALMARREVYEQAGALDPVYVAYFEDADLCLRAGRLGYRTVAALEAKVLHQVGRSGEKRFLWQTAYRMRNHVLFFLRFARPRHWFTLVPALFLFQLPYIALQTTRAFLARKLLRRKYAHRPITLWGYERAVEPVEESQVEEWLDQARESVSRYSAD